ncbi:MAG: DNA polymerase I [Anaerolineae bacterium]|jgi:DNA polymerase-1|nr:MAG: DNA polymerase I [Anaerolineae bacterium]
MPPILYLIDGHALAYRAYYALTRGNPEGFRTKNGEPTAGTFGFVSVLLRLLESEKPQYLAVAFDTGRTFRDQIFADYKATRAKMPEDLSLQIDRIRQILDALQIPRLEVEGYEADDVLGSIAKRVVREGYAVKIITGDRDLLQLVDERIVVNLPGKTLSEAENYFPETVRSVLGIAPQQVVDYKALVGDKADNIPGVRGIGEKTAISLLQKYPSLDEIYAHLDEIPETLRKKLIADREMAYLSRKLATIVTDLKIPFEPEQARLGQFDLEQVETIFRQLEFRTLMSRFREVAGLYGFKLPGERSSSAQLSLFSDAPPATVSVQASADLFPYELVDSEAALQACVQRLEQASVIALDTETTATDAMRAELVGISLAISGEKGYYLPLGHHGQADKQLPLPQVLDVLRKPLTDPKVAKIGHNLKYDFIVLARHGLRVQPLTFDSMIAEWLCDPNSHNLGLKNLAWVRLNWQMTTIEELIGKGKKQLSMAEVPIEQVAPYAAADAAVIFHLQPILLKELEEKAARELLEDLEMPLVTVLADMEMAGICLDVQRLRELSKELEARLKAIEAQIYAAAGTTFNLNSPPQLSEVLFNRLRIAPPNRNQRTASGFYSTRAGVLEELRGKHPVVDWILEYRELAKLKSTYLDALPLQVNPKTGRVHTSFNQTGSVTGRLASSEPNLQNIPVRSETGRQVRQAFVAAPGCVLISADYSQVELRIVAHIAQDEAMLAAFRADQDIHAATAAAIYNVPIEAVTKDQRRHAKAINFGLIYGMSPFGLTRTTDLTLAEAENFVEAYFRQFPGVKVYLERARLQATQQGYVETLLGRRRYFPTLKTEKNPTIRNREEREAINAPIQGTAADIIKLAMIRVPSALRGQGLSAKLILQVHDELLLECPEDEALETARVVKQVMEAAYPLCIPLKTETRYGKNWDALQPFEI